MDELVLIEVNLRLNYFLVACLVSPLFEAISSQIETVECVEVLSELFHVLLKLNDINN